MASEDRKLREKQELRRLILEAARKIVLDDGFAALTMRRLADAIEYAPGTIYLYFAGRDEIARELCRDAFRELFEYMEPVSAVRDPRERLRVAMQLYVQFGMEHPEIYRLAFMENPKITDAVMQGQPLEDESGPGQRVFAMLVTALEELRAAGRLRSARESFVLAEMIWTAIHGIVSLKLTCPAYPVTSAEVLMDATAESLLDGIVS